MRCAMNKYALRYPTAQREDVTLVRRHFGLTGKPVRYQLLIIPPRIAELGAPELRCAILPHYSRHDPLVNALAIACPNPRSSAAGGFRVPRGRQIA